MAAAAVVAVERYVRLVKDPRPAAHGVPALFQGGYGARGNLELFAPSPTGGITCCWFNSDPPDGAVTEPSIPAATWSAGLLLGAGTTYDAVAGLQTRRGPDHLEVVASGTHGLDLWNWSPEHGFMLRDTLAAGAGRPFVAEVGDVLVCGLAEDSRLRRWWSGDGRAEELGLSAPALAVSATADGTVHAVHASGQQLTLTDWTADGDVRQTELSLPHGTCAVSADADPTVVVASRGALHRWSDGGAVETQQIDHGVDALACASSTMGVEQHLEVLARVGASLRHYRWAPVRRS